MVNLLDNICGLEIKGSDLNLITSYLGKRKHRKTEPETFNYSNGSLRTGVVNLDLKVFKLLEAFYWMYFQLMLTL